MKAALLFTAAVCLSAAATTEGAIEPPPSSSLLGADRATIEKQVGYYSSMGRGFIQGYSKGMFKAASYKTRSECLGAETQKNIVDFFAPWGTDQFSWTTGIITVQKSLLLISDWCEFDEAIYSYFNFCYETEQCELPNMVQTILKKVFQVTTVANDFAQIFMEGIPKTADDATKIETFADRIGTNCGKLLRYATDFDPTLYPMLA